MTGTGVDFPSPNSEKFLVGSRHDSRPTILERYLSKKDVRYPANDSLLKEINSNFEQQFEKVSQALIEKIASLNQELQREVAELPKKHDIEDMHEKHTQKHLEDEIKYLRKFLGDQQKIHLENSRNLKILQENISHQYKVLYSVFIGFIIAVLSLCLYNVPITIMIPIISINLYYLMTVLL